MQIHREGEREKARSNPHRLDLEQHQKKESLFNRGICHRNKQFSMMYEFLTIYPCPPPTSHHTQFTI